MGKASKTKGRRGELEVAAILRAHGLPGRRTAQYCGNTGDASDVVGLDGYHVEVKRCENVRMFDWIAQAEHDAKTGETPIVVFRKNGTRWYVTLPFDGFLAAVKADHATQDQERN